MLLRLEDPDSRPALLTLCRRLAQELVIDGAESAEIVELQDAFYDFGRALDPTNPEAGGLLEMGDTRPFPERVAVLWSEHARLFVGRGVERSLRMVAELVELQASYLLAHDQVLAADAAQSFAAELRRHAARHRRRGPRPAGASGRDPTDVRKRP